MSDRQQKWDRRFMEIAEVVSTWSKDRSTKVGCVIVSPDLDIVATGFNGFPRGIRDDVEARHERPEKYFWAEHGERNAIFAAARLGRQLKGCTIYVPWPPCADCSRAIIQAGISTIVTCELSPGDPLIERWGDQIMRGKAMFAEAGVTVRYLPRS